MVFDEVRGGLEVIGAGSVIRFDQETNVFVILQIIQVPSTHDFGSTKTMSQVSNLTREDTRGLLWADMKRVAIQSNILQIVDAERTFQSVFLDSREKQKVSVLGTLSDFSCVDDDIGTLVSL